MDATTWGWADVQGIVTLAGMMGTVLMGGIGYGILKQKTTQSSADAVEAREKAQAVSAELGAFRAEAERRFVTDETLNRVEERIVAAIDRLGDRLDRIIDSKAGTK